uniref:Late nodulin domain-containing protein n=1 Tax=Medicago truncatula TaxID=3880 RepID=I3SBH7_MEDTR|nr:unknown [Medicago truncatula]
MTIIIKFVYIMILLFSPFLVVSQIFPKWCLYDKDCLQNMCRPGRIPKCIFGHCNCVKQRS